MISGPSLFILRTCKEQYLIFCQGEILRENFIDQ